MDQKVEGQKTLPFSSVMEDTSSPKAGGISSPRGCNDCAAGRVHECLEDEDEDMEENMEDRVDSGQLGKELVLEEGVDSEEEEMDLDDEEYNSPQNSPEKVEKGKVIIRGLTIKSTKVSEDKNFEHQKAPKPNQLPLGLSFKSKPVSNEKAGVSQRKENKSIESNHGKTAETNTAPDDETMAIALAIAAAKSPNSKRQREPTLDINKTLPSLTVKPKKAKTSDVPTSGELTMNKVQNIFEGLQEESVSKKDETKKNSASKVKKVGESERPITPQETTLTVQNVQDILQNVKIDNHKAQKNKTRNDKVQQIGNRSPANKSISNKPSPNQKQKANKNEVSKPEELPPQNPALDTQPALDPSTESNLEQAFLNDEYPMLSERKVLAASLNLSEKAVRAWFVSRRAAKFEGRKSPSFPQDTNGGLTPATPASSPPPSNSPSALNQFSSSSKKSSNIQPIIPSPENSQPGPTQLGQHHLPQAPPSTLNPTNPLPPRCPSCRTSNTSRAELLRHLQADHYDVYITELLAIFFTNGSNKCRQCGTKCME